MIKTFQIFAVAGKPIIHSKSPIMFNSYFKNNEKRSYIRIASETAEELVEIIKELQIEGVNITAPFKSSIVKYLDDCDEIVRTINATNLIKNIDGKLKGFNTDIDGVNNSLLNSGVSFKNKKCLVIGAGGAAAAAVSIAKINGAIITIINRNIDKAKFLSEKFSCNYGSLSEFKFYIKVTDIIINTIPINILDLNLINKNQVLLNADYKMPIADTKFKYIDGKKWLIEQAIASLKLFTNEEISSSVFEKYLIIENKKNRNNIVLIGFAGSGKTAIGKVLAKKLGFDFLDTDLLIEQKTGITINDIFKSKGEDYFRKVESKILSSMLERKKTVIATGGGIVLKKNNRKILKNIGDVFWIYSKIKDCYSRLVNSKNEPVFDIAENQKRDFKKFNAIFEGRLANYSVVSDVLVYNNKSIEKVVDRIHYEINQKI